MKAIANIVDLRDMVCEHSIYIVDVMRKNKICELCSMNSIVFCGLNCEYANYVKV